MENTAFNASAAQSRFPGLGLASMSRSKCTMHRWQRAFGSSSPTAATGPVHRSPVTSLTPFKPRAMWPVMNSRRLSTSSFMPSATASASRRPSAPTPIATSTLTFSTLPPHSDRPGTPCVRRCAHSAWRR